MNYAGVTGQWAVTVARRVHRHGFETASPLIDETWVGIDLALYLRYQVGAHRLAARFRLDVDPDSGAWPTDAERLASSVFHALPTDPGPDPFVDECGYRWWSAEVPRGGWSAAVHSRRIVTIS